MADGTEEYADGDYWENGNWDNYYTNDDDDHDNDQNDENAERPTINTMSSATVDSESDQVNNFDIKNDSHMNLIYRRMISGQCFRLPNTPTCPDDVFESWMATFLTESSEDTSGKSRYFRFAWTQDRKGDMDVPIARYFCAKKYYRTNRYSKKLWLYKPD